MSMNRDHSQSRQRTDMEAYPNYDDISVVRQDFLYNRESGRHSKRGVRERPQSLDNQHNIINRRSSSRKSKRFKQSDLRKRDEELIRDLLPSSSLEGSSPKVTSPKSKSGDSRPSMTRKDKRSVRSSSEPSRRKKADKGNKLKFSPKEKARRHGSKFPTPTIPNVVKIPMKLLSIMVEFHLLWWCIQLLLFVWITTRVDWKLRVRTPIAEFPGYSAPRMPWLPSQLGMRNRLYVAWISLAFVYLPAVIYHMANFIDYYPQIKEHIPYSRRPKPKPWFQHERYTHLIEPKSRQLLTFSLLVLGGLLWIYYVVVFLSDTFFPIQDAYWHRRLEHWLYELQRHYFLQFGQLKEFIPQKYYIQSHHTPDDGSRELLIIDLVQSMFECCGRSHGFADWNSPHVYRPKNHTYRKAMGIPMLYERAHYLMPTLTNDSVPFSCCRWKHTVSSSTPVPCDHILMKNTSTVFDRGCVEPLSRFIQLYWMQTHLVPLLLVIATMIPQLLLFLVTVQPKELKTQAREALEEIRDYILQKWKEFLSLMQSAFNALSKTSSQLVTTASALIWDIDDMNADFYKIVREEVAASEREIYEKKEKPKRKRPRSRRRGDRRHMRTNIKPSPHLQNRRTPTRSQSRRPGGMGETRNRSANSAD